jgi:hypothetical protein
MYCCEPLPGRPSLNQSTNLLIVELGYRPAGSADQKLTCMRNIRIGAADKCIKRIKPVNQVGFDQKFQRPINCWWRRFVPVLIQTVQDVVRADRLMTVPDQLEDSFPLSGESQATLPANSLGILHRLLDTSFVVVFISGNSAAWYGIAHRVIRCPEGTRLYRAFESMCGHLTFGSDAVFCTIARDRISLTSAGKNAKN